jgi:hypothetical protein
MADTIELPPITVVGEAPITQMVAAETYPTIRISTVSANAFADDTVAVTVEFEYLPESLSFGVTANYEKHPLPLTSAQWVMYSYTTIDDISLSVKVVAGCNNAIVNYSSTEDMSWGLFASLKATKTVRNNLITLAKLLYALTLPPTNDPGAGSVPPNCNLTIGPYCRVMGYFGSVNIKFSGPYDWDGSPTEMDVDLNFTPTEFTALNDPKQATGADGAAINPSVLQTMSGISEIKPINNPYAIWVGQNTNPAAPAAPPPSSTPSSPSTSSILSAEGVQNIAQRDAGLAPGPATSQEVTQKTGTYTSANIAEAYGLPLDLNNPDEVNNQIRRYQNVDPTTGTPSGPYFYDIGSTKGVPESVVNDNVARYDATTGLTTSTNTTFTATKTSSGYQ